METPARDEVVPSASRSEDPREAPAYEPPRLNTLGTIEELTMGGNVPETDFGEVGSQSDRRLKHGLAEVDRRAVLRGVASLRISG
jgi:hypothetical protein